MIIVKNLLPLSIVLCALALYAENAAAQTADVSASARVYAPAPSPSSARLGLQGRFDALNMISEGEFMLNDPGDVLVGGLFVPIVTPGFRFLEDRLYLGLGLGFGGYDAEEANGDETARSAFSLSPLAMYDVLTDRYAALSLGGWFNFLILGETDESNDDAFGIGLNLAAGIRGKISPGLAIGSEFGWGFINLAWDNDNDVFFHGLFGTIFFEASVGI
jgi:hypothetical protein